MAIGTAFKAFFATLFNKETSQRVEAALQSQALPAPEDVTPEKIPECKPEPAKPSQSEAITLLATLQREARFVDFIMEPLDGYADAQVGAAAREVHRDAAKVIARLFDIKPLHDADEMATVDVPEGFDAAQYHLTGKLTGESPLSGTLQHHGWVASKCELPEWHGSKESARVLAPVEVEVK